MKPIIEEKRLILIKQFGKHSTIDKAHGIMNIIKTTFEEKKSVLLSSQT